MSAEESETKRLKVEVNGEAKDTGQNSDQWDSPTSSQEFAWEEEMYRRDSQIWDANFF